MAVTLTLQVATQQQLSILMPDGGFCRSRAAARNKSHNEQMKEHLYTEFWCMSHGEKFLCLMVRILVYESRRKVFMPYGPIGLSLSSSFILAGKKYLDDDKVHIYGMFTTNTYLCM